MARLRALALGHQTVMLRPRLLLAAWLLHASFAALAAGPAASVFTNSLVHRPAFSNEVLHDFSLDLLIDWRAAYGDPLRPYFKLALILAALYGVAKVLLDTVIYPAYLHPFDEPPRFRTGNAVRGILAASLLGLGLSIALLGLLMPLSRWPAAALALLFALAFLRVLTCLWKCAGAQDASFSAAFFAIRKRPGATLWLTLATLASGAVLLAASGGVAWYGVGSPHVVRVFLLQQVLIFAAVWLRLWLSASAVVLWRAVAIEH